MFLLCLSNELYVCTDCFSSAAGGCPCRALHMPRAPVHRGLLATPLEPARTNCKLQTAMLPDQLMACLIQRTSLSCNAGERIRGVLLFLPPPLRALSAAIPDTGRPPCPIAMGHGERRCRESHRCSGACLGAGDSDTRECIVLSVRPGSYVRGAVEL